MYPLNDERYCQ